MSSRGSPACRRGNPQAVARGGRDDGTPLATPIGISMNVFVIDRPLGGSMRRVFRDIQSRVPSPHAPRVPQLPWLYTPHARRLFVGMGLMLVSLFGSLTCPATFVAGVEPTADGDDRGPSDDWNHRSERRPRDHRDDWSYGRPGSALPDRDTMHNGKTCELACERIGGTRADRGRAYRCEPSGRRWWSHP